MLNINYWVVPAVNRVRKRRSKCNIHYDDIVNVVSSVSGVDYCDIKGNRLFRKFIIPRHVCIYLLYNYTNLSLSRIGFVLRRDHSTVLHAIQNVKNAIDTNENHLVDLLDKCTEELRKMFDID